MKVETLNSMQIVSFLLFIGVRCGAGEKQCVQRTF